MFKKLLLALTIATSSISSATNAEQLTESGWWVEVIGDTDRNDHAVIIFQAINNNGQLAICGSIFNKGIPSRLLRNVMGNYLISVNNSPVLRNINSFGRANSEEQLTQASACRDAGRPWVEGANELITTRLTRRNY